MSSSADKERRRRNGSKHDKTGCLTCRYRRKKCTDNSFPVCGTCSRLNLKCVRQETKDIVPDAWVAEKRVSSDANSSATFTQPAPPAGLSLPGTSTASVDSPQKREAMRYYISVLTTYLTVSQEFNSFLTAFLPMALESVALFDALLAMASGHLSLTDESYKVAALETRSAAIRSLATAISTPSDQIAYHETNAAACLGFVIYEAGVGDCRAWQTHLKGAQNILKSTSAYSGGKLLRGPEAFKLSTEGQWILRNYAYHDIIGSITLQKTPLLHGDYLDGITDVVDSCIGVAAGLLRIIARIGFLDEETTIKERTSNDEIQEKLQQLQFAYSEIEQELLTWQCHANASSGLAALAYTYRNAALIVLYRLVRSRLRSGRGDVLDLWGSEADAMGAIQAKIQEQVADTLAHVSTIPVGSAPEGALLFPIFIVGGEAVEQDHIDIVRSRLRLMARKRQFRNLLQAREVLEDLWDLRKTTQGVNADWTQILEASGEDLLLT